MFDCDCGNNCDFDYAPEFFNIRTIKAKKNHICCECGKKIQPGEKYDYTAGKWEGDFFTYKTCQFCAQVRTDFRSCACIGELWEDLKMCWGEDAHLLGISN